MTDTIETFTPETLTGEQVMRIRTAYHLSRSELAIMCGYPKTGVRIGNIERKESWKEGDRQKLNDVLTGIIANPPRDRLGRMKGESGSDRAARLDGMLRNGGTHAGDVDPKASGVTAPDVGPMMGDDDPDAGVVVADPFVPDLSDLEFEAVDDGIKDLTNSEVGVWLRCPRKWWLSVYRMLTLKQQDYTGYRAIGNRVHRALAAWYVPDGQERTDPRQALERAIVEDWTAIAVQARQHPSYIDDEQSLAELSTRYHTAVSLERAMVEGYMEWVIEKGDDAQYSVIAPETEMHAIIEGDVAGEHVVFRARALLDVRIRRTVDGVRLFEDHKTVGSTQAPQKTLHMNPQMLHYHLLEFLNTPEGEARCDGALYNMLRRVKRTPRAKPPFYERVEVHHNPYEIDSYRRRLLGLARSIMRAERDLDGGADPMSIVPPNPTGDCSWDCDFFPICPMFDDGSRVEDAITALYKVQDPMARYDQGTMK